MLDFSMSDGTLRVGELLTARGEALLEDGRMLSTQHTPDALAWETDGLILRLRLRNNTSAMMAAIQG